MGEREIRIPVVAILVLSLCIACAGAAITLSGVTAYYPLDGSAGDTAGIHEGTVYGAIPAPGVSGSSYSFDGVHNYLSLPRTISDDFTLVFWVSTTRTAPAGPQWYKGNGLVDAEVYDVRNDFGTALLGSKAGFGVGNPDSTIVSTTDINDGRWHQIVAERTRSTGEMKLYVDGILEARGTGSTASLSDPPFIGVGNNPCDIDYDREWFQGSIDEIQLYPRVLGNDEIQKLFRAVRYQIPVKFTPPPATLAPAGTPVAETPVSADRRAIPEISTFSDLSFMNWPVFYTIVPAPPAYTRQVEPLYLILPALLILCSLLVLIIVFHKSRKTGSKTRGRRAVRGVVSVLFAIVLVASCYAFVFESARVDKNTDSTLVNLGLKNATYVMYPSYQDRMPGYGMAMAGLSCDISDAACMLRQQEMQMHIQQSIQQQNMMNRQNYQVQQQMQQAMRVSRGF